MTEADRDSSTRHEDETMLIRSIRLSLIYIYTHTHTRQLDSGQEEYIKYYVLSDLDRVEDRRKNNVKLAKV